MAEPEKGILQPVKTFSYRWKIERFFADCKKVGDFYASPVFPIDCCGKVTKWYLKVYPKGHREECKGFVSLYVCFESGNVSDKVTVNYKLSIVREQNSSNSKISLAKLFKGPKDVWGCSRFVTQKCLRRAKNRALVDDTLIILFDITICDQTVAEKLNDRYHSLLDNVGKGLEDYETLLESNHFSDVTFNIQNNKMHLHKAILMCRNPVFKAMFKQEARPGKRQKLMDVVEITDVPYEVMKEIFRFIYSGKVGNIDQITKDLLIAADKYAIPELKALCEKKLYDNLTVDNAIEYLKLTDVCDTIHLKTLVMEFTAAHIKEIVKKPGFTDLDKQVMHQIIQLMTEKD